MINFLQNLYSRVYTNFKIRNYKANNKLLWLLSILFVRCLSSIIYWGYLLRSILRLFPKRLTGEGDLIVSLTSFPARIDNVWMTIDSIMRQKLRPAKIMLYLSKEEFPQGRDSLPARLKEYEDLGVCIVFVNENLRPHKKYFYCFLESRDKCVVTVDDDFLYNDAVLQRLWNIHLDHPECVCANKGRLMLLGEEGFLPYNCWNEIIKSQDFIGKDILACGYGGVLYPPEFYLNYRDKICDSDTIKETSLRADDLWLKAQELKAGVDVCVRSYYPQPVSIPSSSKTALSKTNWINGAHGNDVQWKNLVNKYDLTSYFFP